MAKKRKTRQEKIILQLKRELTHLRQGSGGQALLDSRLTEGQPRQTARQAKKESGLVFESTVSQPRQEAISELPQIKTKRPSSNKKAEASILFYDPRLVKKDLLKTFALTIIVLVIESVLYLKLR